MVFVVVRLMLLVELCIVPQAVQLPLEFYIFSLSFMYYIDVQFFFCSSVFLVFLFTRQVREGQISNSRYLCNFIHLPVLLYVLVMKQSLWTWSSHVYSLAPFSFAYQCSFCVRGHPGSPITMSADSLQLCEWITWTLAGSAELLICLCTYTYWDIQHGTSMRRTRHANNELTSLYIYLQLSTLVTSASGRIC